VHSATPPAPTFRLFDRRYGPTPAAFDFVFVSDTLSAHVRHIEVDLQTQASDHQPVRVAL
jgi:endonuclease/exonuclease/phosphatase family metal-dependent hydrolase